MNFFYQPPKPRRPKQRKAIRGLQQGRGTTNRSDLSCPRKGNHSPPITTDANPFAVKTKCFSRPPVKLQGGGPLTSPGPRMSKSGVSAPFSSWERTFFRAGMEFWVVGCMKKLRWFLKFHPQQNRAHPTENCISKIKSHRWPKMPICKFRSTHPVPIGPRPNTRQEDSDPVRKKGRELIHRPELPTKPQQCYRALGRGPPRIRPHEG